MPRPDIEFSQNLDLLMQQVLQTRPPAPFISTVPISLPGNVTVHASWIRLRPTWVHFNGQMHAPNGPPTLSVTVAGTVDGSADRNPAPGPWVAFATAEPFHVTVNYELQWDGHQQTNDLVAAPPSARSSDGRGPPLDPLPRSRTDGRRFTIVHPAVEFEDGLPRSLRPNRRALGPDGTTVYAEHSPEVTVALMAGVELKTIARPALLPYLVWPDEYRVELDAARPFSWFNRPDPAVRAVVEEGVDRLLREVLGVVLAAPTALAREYGPLGINLFTLHLQGPMFHVIGQPYDPNNFWGADGQTADAIEAIPGGLPAALEVNTRVRVSTEAFVRSLHQRVERADVLRDATAGLGPFFHLQSSLPAIAAGGAWPNGLASRDALEPGFAVWLREQLVLDGRASREQVDDGNIVQIFNAIQAEDDEAFAYYAELYLSTLTTDIWPLAGEVEGFSVTLSRPWVAPLTDEELVAVQPATGPGQHAAFRLRMAFDTAFGDGNFRFYIVPGVDPFLNFDATVLPATSSHAALWTQFVFEVIGDIVLLVLGVGDLFGLWDTGDTFGPFDALYPAGIPGHLLAKAVEPLGRDVAIGISADAGESSGLDSIIAEAEEIDPLPELAALAQALAGLGATLTPMGPGPIVRSAVSDPENGTVIGFDLPPDENNLRRADGRGGSRVTGDGIARPLSTVVDVEGRPVTVDVVPENRWHESLFFDNWLGCELRIEADAHRTAFIARRGAFGTPSDFLMLSAAAVEAGVMNGDLVPVERLALSFPWHDGDSGSMFWAVRLGQQAPTWLLGVSAAPRLPLHGASVLRAGFAAQALRDVAQGYGAPFILERWDAIRDTPLGDLAPGNLGVTQRALDGFRDDIVRILGPWFGDRPDGDNVVLAMTPGTLASMLGGDRTEDMRADLAEAKHRLARFLRNAQANVVATIAAGDWDTLVDPEGIGMSDVEARLLEEAVRAHEIVAEASLADVLRRYDVRARPEHWIRAVAATPAVRAVRVEGVVFRADDSTRPHTFDDVFAIRTYQIYPNWTARIRLVSVGYDPSTNFRLRLLVEGVDGQADVVAGARINSVDPLAVGLRANAADLRFEAISESVSLNFQLPEGFPATEPVNGRDRVSVEVSVDNRVIATAVFLMPLVAAVEVELTAAGRTLRDRVAGHADRNAAMRRMQAALPGRVVDADADLDVVPTNPAVDDLLGHLTPRSLPPRRPPPPIPPHPAFRRPGVEARDWDPLDLPPVEVSTAWLHRFPMFDADGGLGKRLRRPASGPMFRIER